MRVRAVKVVHVPTYTAQIYIGGDFEKAKMFCRKFCDEVGECVTVEPVHYAFTDGSEEGVRVGFINYGRFPREPDEILSRATALAAFLITALRQESATVLGSDGTIWMSERKEDVGG